MEDDPQQQVESLLPYERWIANALRHVVVQAIEHVMKHGLPGGHHFYIAFRTTYPGVVIPPRLRAQYPEEMTIVLQHQFWDLKVTDEAFEVGLSFGGVAERLLVPFDAIKAFADPSVQFTLQFEQLAEAPDEDPDKVETAKPAKSKRRAPGSRESGRTSVPASPLPAAAASEAAPDRPPEKPGDKGGAEVVRLDRFRKK
jgi:hypothetical protein